MLSKFTVIQGPRIKGEMKLFNSVKFLAPSFDHQFMPRDLKMFRVVQPTLHISMLGMWMFVPQRLSEVTVFYLTQTVLASLLSP